MLGNDVPLVDVQEDSCSANDVPLVLDDGVQEDLGSRTERKKLLRTFSERNGERNVSSIM